MSMFSEELREQWAKKDTICGERSGLGAVCGWNAGHPGAHSWVPGPVVVIPDERKSLATITAERDEARSQLDPLLRLAADVGATELIRRLTRERDEARRQLAQLQHDVLKSWRVSRKVKP